MTRIALALLALLAVVRAVGAQAPMAGADPYPLPAEAIRRFGSTSFRHPHPVLTFRVRPDGKVVYTTDGRSIYGWDLATGRRIFATPASENPYCWSGIGCSATRLRAVAAESGGFVVVDLDADSGRELRKSKVVLVGQGGSVALSPDGEWLLQFAIPTADELAKKPGQSWMRCRVADAAGEGKAFEIGELNSAYFARFARDGTVFAVMGSQATGPIRAYDPRTGAKIREWERGMLMQYHGTSNHAITAWDQNPGTKLTLKAWDAKSGKSRSLTDASPHPAGYVVSPGDGVLAVQAAPHWHDWVFTDLAAGKELGRLRLAGYPAQGFGEITPDGKTFVTAGYGQHGRDHVVAPWTIATGEPTASGTYPCGAVTRLQFTRDGDLLAAADGRIRMWDSQGTLRSHGSVIDCEGWTSAEDWDMRPGSIRVVRTKRAFSPVTYTQASIMDAKTGKVESTVGAKLGAATAELAFSGDGTHLFWEDRDDLSIAEWDLKADRLVRKRKSPGIVRVLRASPNGRWLAAVSTNSGRVDEPSQAVVWDLQDAERPPHKIDWPGASYMQLKWSGKDSLLVSGCGPKGFTVVAWDFAAGKELSRATVPLPTGFRPGDPVALSPDGTTLAMAPRTPPTDAASKGYVIHLIELFTGHIRHSFVGHGSPITALAFADNYQLAAASQDAPIYLWDVRGDVVRAAVAPTAASLETAWADLRSADPKAAFAAVRVLAGHPDRSVPFLSGKLSPVAPADPRRFDESLKALGSPRFAERERAMKELAGLGRSAERSLREAAAATKSAEVRRRLEELLARFPPGERSPDDLQAARAVEAAAWSGSPQARELLTRWSQGVPTAPLTLEAVRALKLLER